MSSNRRASSRNFNSKADLLLAERVKFTYSINSQDDTAGTASETEADTDDMAGADNS